jgi:hypothetical protein
LTISTYDDFFGDAQPEKARSCASPIKNITSCSRSLNFRVEKYAFFEYPDAHAELLGFLPKTVAATRGSIGTFEASFFFERISSCANLAVATGVTASDSEDFNTLVVLK